MTNSILIHENELQNNPEISASINNINKLTPPIGYEQLLYPYYFISTDKKKYIRLLMDSEKKSIIPFFGTDESLYRELLSYANNINHHIILVDSFCDWIDAKQMQSIPFGVRQDIDIESFSLQGGRMRKLRHAVNKYQKSGTCQVIEYQNDNELPIDEMKRLMQKWSESKKNVLRLSLIAMQELLQRRLSTGYRAFLSYYDNKLCCIIVLLKLKTDVYLMDQEFYDPQSAPFGHMESAIVTLIARLKSEGALTFSLGLTWYPFIFEDEYYQDNPEGWQWLKAQNSKATLLNKIFTQGQRNYQFKKKFGVMGTPIFAHLPQGASFSLLLNYWSVFYQNSLTASEIVAQLEKKPENPILDNPLDLRSDSWFYVQPPIVEERMNYLLEDHSINADILRQIFPFKYFLFTFQGKQAEHLFYSTFSSDKSKIVTTIPWTTTLTQQLENHFEVIEIPHPTVYQSDSDYLFKGEIDLSQLKHLLQSDKQIAMVGLEVLSNASGGHPVRLSHVRELKALLKEKQIPLVLDATRIVRNACLLKQYETLCQALSVFEIVKQMAELADYIVTSLSKDFGLTMGGLIATNEEPLITRIKNSATYQQQKSTLKLETMFCHSLSEADFIINLINQQLGFIKQLSEGLQKIGVPLLQPAIGHAIVITLPLQASATTRSQQKKIFIEDLLKETGIHASIHQIGKQKNTRLDQGIRLAFPLGLSESTQQTIEQKCQLFFSQRYAPPEPKKPQQNLKEVVNSLSSEQLKALYQRQQPQHYDIAIIGISGRYPQAQTHYEFWQKIQCNTNFIERVPESRWNHSQYYTAPIEGNKISQQKTGCQFGAFLPTLEQFDATFFNVTTNDAFSMDPQERMLLETTWSCIEDAGYSVADLGKQVGVFSGLTYSEYQKLAPVTTHLYTLNGRIAYFFDFQGPTRTTDSGCASSLEALELACQSLIQGDCKSALVNGANLILHPEHYVSAGAGLSTTKTPNSRPFANDDGWIPAEGVVSMLLKPLKQAIKDNDHIYAVIKSAHITAQGKTAWLGAFSPKDQIRLMTDNFNKSGIPPETISYIEPAANGTALGDTIEVHALQKSFEKFTDKKQFCAIGSVKSSIGHGESVSTLQQLSKIILQFKSKTIYPLPLDETNPKINLKNSPFYFQTTASEWKPLTVNIGQHSLPIPRRATVSSFAAGGNIGHIILEEFQAIEKQATVLTDYFICLSAPTLKQLQHNVKNHLIFLTKQMTIDTQWQHYYTLFNIMYTLCIGRQPFKQRVVFIAKDVPHLIQLLTDYAVVPDPEHTSIIKTSQDGVATDKSHSINLHTQSWRELAENWVNGGTPLEWADFFQNYSVQRISLPTYCFQKQSFPIAKPNMQSAEHHEQRPPLSQQTNTVHLMNPLENKMTQLIATLLNVDATDLDPESRFFEFGIDSVQGVKLVEVINDVLTLTLEVPVIYDYSSIRELSQHILERYPNKMKSIASPINTTPSPKQSKKRTKVNTQSTDIAIIGMSGQFAQAANIQTFWKNLTQGNSSITEVPKTRWDIDQYYHPDPQVENKTYCKWGGFMEDIDKFDAPFFNISPIEAEAMDPQQRIFLQLCWSALEHAGYQRNRLNHLNCGVFAGVTGNDYGNLYMANNDNKNFAHYMLGNTHSILSARIAYFLNLKGPAISIDSACSSSLAAVIMGCENLLHGKSDMILAGGITLYLSPLPFIMMSKAGMLSPSGQSAPFDKRADGIVVGEGAGVVVLKRLRQAEADGDPIHAIIKGFGMNQDGKTNGITAPSSESQKNLELDVYQQNQIDPATISYIEAHGTGTKLGDPIEVTALKAAFRQYTSKKQFCALGSVKSNIGHTSAAAGIASLIKTTLALQHKEIPPAINFQQENEQINLADSPFYINKQLIPWRTEGDQPLRAAINSFGFSGTNCHLVVEEYCGKHDKSSLPPPYLFVLSAKTASQLRHYALDMKEFITTDISLVDLIYTCQTGRNAMEQRLAMIVSSTTDLKQKLARFIRIAENSEQIYCGQVKKNQDSTLLNAKDDTGTAIETWIKDKNNAQLAQHWIQGFSIDWDKLYCDPMPKRIGLPTYPFAKKRYWITPEKQTKTRAVNDDNPSEILMLKPIWQEKTLDKSTTYHYAKHFIILCDIDKSESIVSQAQLMYLTTNEQNIAKRFSQYALQVFQTIQKLLKTKPKTKILFQVVLPYQESPSLLSGLSGILKTAQLENPKLIGQLIETNAKTQQIQWQDNAQFSIDSHIKYFNEQRFIRTLSEIEVIPEHPRPVWQDNGVYLISGGAGGLGLIFAKSIAKQVKDPILILTGRSKLNKDKADSINALIQHGAQVNYLQNDISQQSAVNTLIDKVIEEYGKINGIIHSAGEISDHFIINKTQTEFTRVLSPKVAGLVNLDNASQHIPLDFFVFFASGAGVIGNMGQADYACANAFMDNYAHYRKTLVDIQARSGKTLSIDWSLWKEGGMQVDDETIKMWMQSSGMVAMETATGIRILEQGFALAEPQIMAMEGDLTRLRKFIFRVKKEKLIETPLLVDTQLLHQKTQCQLKKLFADITKVDFADIDLNGAFENYGIDSIMITQFNQKLDPIFSDVSKTLFYEYQTLAELCDYFVQDYPQECRLWSGIKENQSPPLEAPPTTVTTELKPVRKRPAAVQRINNSPSDKIAIIGMSGLYPQADTLDEFWENLKTGKDCIRKIPEDRWALDNFFEADPDTAVAQAKSYCQWGGFIDKFAEFDPLFFNISPKEALDMDPQERLFIQTCWQVFEDAGYTKEQLKTDYSGRVGIFAGITKTGFELYGPDLWKQGKKIHPHTSFGSLANRVSYLFNLHGPSMPIDTMCSSSLTAVHEACEHLQRGECEMAVAGGVNLYLHPSSYIFLSTLRMVTPDNKCKSFGQGGDGFLPGEGVGAILLKPLPQALNDHDPIHAIIRASGINHGGRTSGYTVPNPTAQAQLIHSVMNKAGISADEISYIEAHGTGTELGDPIEVTGLTQAFKKDSPPTNTCALGSAKSNIGHLEAAAGIAGLTKTVLQMKHKTLVPSLHAKTTNPNINFGKTPFVVQQTLTDWTPAKIKGQSGKRIAGVSSFGAGGVNAHVLLEEYVVPAIPTEPSTDHFIMLLSAKDSDRLIAYAKKIVIFLAQKTSTTEPNFNLRNVCYTFQIGRELMDERLALMINNLDQLGTKLDDFIAGKKNIEGCYHGHVKRKKNKLTADHTDEDMQILIDSWILKKKYTKLLDFWLNGFIIDWRKLYGENQPKRISAPTYPFAEERYWLNEITIPSSGSASQQTACLHPLVQQNTSDLNELRFSSTFKGTEAGFIDHIMTQESGDTMARIAVEIITRNHSDFPIEIQLTNKVWTTPIKVKDTPLTVHIALLPVADNEIVYEIFSLNPKTPSPTIHCQGKALFFETYTEKPAIDKQVIDTLFLKPVWEMNTVDTDILPIPYQSHIVICNTEIPKFKNNTIQSLYWASEGATIDAQFNHYAIQLFEKIKSIVQSKAKTKVLLQVVILENSEQYLFSGLSGLLKTARLENPKLIGQLIETDDIQAIESQLEENSHAPQAIHIRYKSNQRFIANFEPVQPLTTKAKVVWKDQGVYLITGGMGGLGLIFANEIADQAKTPLLILTGRSPLDARKKAQIETLKQTGATVEYHQNNIAQSSDVDSLIHSIVEKHGALNGILHSAGIIRDNFITNKNAEEFIQVLEPKVNGVINLDKASKNIKLDFLILFSSGSGALGNPGQADYACGNAFMDNYAHYRNHLVKENQRHGQTLAINWPLWKDGGMQVDEQTEQMIMQSFGMLAMRTTSGMRAFYQSLALATSQIMLAEGYIERLKSKFITPALQNNQVETRNHKNTAASGPLLQHIKQKIVQQVASLMQIKTSAIDADSELSEYGFDSITLTELANHLNEKYHLQVTPPLFFEYSTINSFSDYLLKEYPDNFSEQPNLSSIPVVNQPITDTDKPRKFPECITFRKNEKSPACFWIHPLSGSVELYAKIVHNLKANLSFYGIRSKGFANNDPFLQHIEEMASYYLEIITQIDPQGPYILAGTSMGGTLAYEITRQLQLKGLKVLNLVLVEPIFSSKQADFTPKTLDSDLLLTASNFFLMAHLSKVTSDYKDLVIKEDDIASFTADKMLDKLAKMCQQKGVNQGIDAISKTIENMANTFINNRNALATYKIAPLPHPDQLDCVLFTGAKNTQSRLNTSELSKGISHLLGNTLSYDETHYQQWLTLLPTLRTIRLPTTDHVDMLSNRKGVEAFIKEIDHIYAQITQINDQKIISSLSRETIKKPASSTVKDIAIIGLNGRFPMAEGLDEFWKNITEGKNCLSKITQARWDLEKLYGDKLSEKQKSEIQWAGFIEGVRDFDPAFFGISQHEANLMDPQQRLLMQSVWKAIEDAGITPKTLAQRTTGVFISPGVNDYQNVVSIPQNDPFAGTGSALSAIPNRISYALNLTGPSEYCETGCSSALVALHRALVSIQRGECEQALVGAVNLLLSPALLISSHAMGHLSSSAEVKSFQADADGFLMSEGVAAILIKPLEQAVAEQDHIYAVIKGSGVSHGGKGMSFTSPTANGMKTAISQALKTAALDPQSIAYIEAHGTGTLFGDAIEIEALKSVYRSTETTKQRSHCYISSLKPCIGHAGIASGMAALFKVILALKNQIIPGLPRFKQLNKNISLANSHFAIQADNQSWSIDNQKTTLPRRAALNSYGFGGVNAHIIIEEYPITDDIKTSSSPALQTPTIFLFSAKNEERLKRYVTEMLAFFSIESAHNLNNIAYTLQTGREAMDYRLAIVATSIATLQHGLQNYLNLPSTSAKKPIALFTGNKNSDYSALKELLEGDAELAVLDIFLQQNDVEKLAQYWVKGFDIPWSTQYQALTGQKISLPTYPFEKVTCWLTERHSTALKSTTTSTYVAPRHTTESILVELWEQALNQHPIGIDDNFFEIGGNSVIAVGILNKIASRFKQHLPLATLFNSPTISTLARRLKDQPNITINPVLVPLQPNGEKSPLFFLPGGRGRAFYLHELAQCLDQDRPIYALEEPGIYDDSKQPATTHQALTDIFVNAILAYQPQGPYYIAGHSAGALIAFIIIHALEKQGHEVAFFGVLDMVASFTEVSPSKNDSQYLIDNARIIAQRLKADNTIDSKKLQSLTYDKQLQQVAEQLTSMGWLPQGDGAKQLANAINISKIRKQLLQSHPLNKINAPIILFKSTLPHCALENYTQINTPDMGWKNYSTQPLKTLMIPGNHITMMTPPHVQILAQQLKQALVALITTKKHEFSAIDDEGKFWSMDKIHFPNPVSPLDYSLVLKIIYDDTAHSVPNYYDFPVLQIHSRHIGGYLYCHYMNAHEEADENRIKKAAKAMKKDALSIETRWQKEWLPQLKAHLLWWQTFESEHADADTLANHLIESQKHLQQIWEIHHILYYNTMYSLHLFEEMIEDLFPEQNNEYRHQLLAGFVNQYTETEKDLWKLSRMVLRSPNLRQLFKVKNNDQCDILGQLKQKKYHKFAKALTLHLDNYGTITNALNEPSFHETPEDTLAKIQQYLTLSEQHSPLQQLTKLQQIREKEVQKANDKLINYPKFIQQQFTIYLHAAQQANRLVTEHTWWIEGRVPYQVRMIVLDAGKRLKESASISKLEDVFYLHFNELKNALEKLPETTDFSQLIQARKKEAQHFSDNPPQFIGEISTAELPKENIFTQIASQLMPTPKPYSKTLSNELTGIPGSPGKITGTARIIHSVSEGIHKLKPGDIMITETTLPNWVALFGSISGLVTDTGGALCHSAIVAREYGIPAVVGTAIATTHIKEGQRIEIDGHQGRVKIIQPMES